MRQARGRSLESVLHPLAQRIIEAHWGVPDPSKAQGSEAERMEAFRAAYRLLAERIDLFLSLGPEAIVAQTLKRTCTMSPSATT
jgi:hypothetical protein